ncbi:RulB protein [Pseudomonas syringae pv. actinidiae ICMP 18804]|uniref:RulB protein n=4 Tax=Pseudomonas syringae TaxID=317 RepID=A0A656K5L2_PSESF|nr:RulB protein [Pseudomonas syringae pv. actinidiae ICMP 19098]EPN06971.1 RulB protein [Pseudomonas syringae pv. actinidiae ICMP 18804]EPN15128.1 RulB protein [Pseudomonas syringae pv. actinidiae ICMP 19100]EPN28572.1 RulB protein [Pseudomonas syringae pv. actinidiae ICMP 19099]EPN31140.1 RulB protein [Pseudomonas syringae pv. actinidiae ICMP 18883]EPN33070.1 RulB protein [Pseudomonas syringae pv. actinidiae ICMP 18807]EPN43840.1 RulB protein [Pseudomonas syringae pv. actinidiae ICMP 19095]
MLRKTFSVVIEKTARELAGTACLELDEVEPPRQEICCSRMFGKRLTELGPIKEAAATYMMRASEKLRAQGSVCKKILVSIRTGMGHAADLRNAQFKACLVGEPAEFGKNRTTLSIEQAA